jgi:ketosteroid isomerase-like protein
MYRLPRLALAVSILLLPACALGAAKQAPVDAGSVQAFVRSFAEAANRGDVKALGRMYSHEHGVSSINDGEIAQGWEAVRKNNDFLSMKEGAYKFDIESVDVTSLGPSYALAVVPLKLTISGSQDSVELPSVMSLVLEKSGPSWLIVHEHLSSESDEGGDDDDGPDSGEGPAD